MERGNILQENLLASELGIGSGKLRNDIWIGRLGGSQSSWKVDDRYINNDGSFNPNLIRSQMTWTEINPGRLPPPIWPTDQQDATPLTNEEWMACQDSIQHKLIDPSICNAPPIFCYENILIPGCSEQAVWKRDNMWSPRRGLAAAVANNKIYVIGGHAREYARIDDSRLVGDIAGKGRVETGRDHSTIREEAVLKNDVWSSEDEGRTWQLVNPGCEDHQQDVLLETEVWSRDTSDPLMRKNVGSIGSKCFLSSECVGIAECLDLSNTNEKVCVCPMFSPREHHTLSVQRRFSIQDDGSVYEEDVLYVVGGFTSVKQSFCADRACGPEDGYRVSMDDIWMSSDGGVTWQQIKPAFDTQSNFVGRGRHSAVIVPMSFGNNTDDTNDRLLILGGETANPLELSTTYLNDIWEMPLPTKPCCKPNTPCAGDYECIPNKSEFNIVKASAEWSERSGHVTVYEPPSSSNSFEPRIYLTGGANKNGVMSDVWNLYLGKDDDDWQCDFSSEIIHTDSIDSGSTSPNDAYLSIDSSLSTIRNYALPSLDVDGNIDNMTAHISLPIMSSREFAVMESSNISSIQDLALAGLYTVLKLRGFDYPGRATSRVADVCLLREIAIAFMEKCTLNEFPASYFHAKAHSPLLNSSSHVKSSNICGRGGESEPCNEDDWDGCSPMDVSVVDVHGIGNVNVPQIRHNVSTMVDELFCRQVPSGRSMGAAAYLSNKIVVLGGMNSNTNHLFRDVWARDDDHPRAIIKTKPTSFTPQFTFFFDSNEDGAHVFEYKIFRGGEEMTNWTTTTSSIGADISWLDDKKEGPGKGLYTLYVRAVDPGGNRDISFSTKTNVYQWVYVPPIPWGSVAGGILTGLVMIIGGYFEYRRRRRKATLEKFALRRLKRRFKLRNEGIHPRNAFAEMPATNNLRRPLTRERRTAEILGHVTSSGDLMPIHRRSNESPGHHQSLRKRHDTRPESGRSHSASHRSHSSSRRSHSTPHRSRSSSKPKEDPKTKHRRERKRPKEDAADVERRRRRRRDREKNRRKNQRDY